MSTIEQIVRRHVGPMAGNSIALLTADLAGREDEIADNLRLAAIQFGLFPEIVAKVLTDIGLGTPPSEQGKAMIEANFKALMDRLHEEHMRGEHGDDSNGG